MLNYAIPALTTLFALFELVKDWDAHKRAWRRVSVLLIIVALGMVGMYLGAKNDRQASEQASKINSLTTAVQTSSQNQVQNTKVFTESIERFSTKLTNLETGIKTADLRDQADNLRAELTKTQKALVTPQAVLTAGIEDPRNKEVPQYSTHVVAQKGQPITVTVRLWNKGEVSARAGLFLIRLCTVCKFHSLPPGFDTVQGQADYDRTIRFERLALHVSSQSIPIEIDVPDYITQFPISFRAPCENCIENKEFQIATVYVTRTEKQPPTVSQPKTQ